jgi:hypothetical protein
MAIAASKPMISTTIMISTSVKPCFLIVPVLFVLGPYPENHSGNSRTRNLALLWIAPGQPLGKLRQQPDVH